MLTSERTVGFHRTRHCVVVHSKLRWDVIRLERGASCCGWQPQGPSRSAAGAIASYERPPSSEGRGSREHPSRWGRRQRLSADNTADKQAESPEYQGLRPQRPSATRVSLSAG